MKITRWPHNVWSFVCDAWEAIHLVEIMIVFAIFGLISAIVIPNYVKTKQEMEKRMVTQQEKAKSDELGIKVGDVVFVKGINTRGAVNSVNFGGSMDILVIGKNGEPTMLKEINPSLLTK